MILKDMLKGTVIKVEVGSEVIQAVIDEDTEFRVLGEDGNPLDPNDYVARIEYGRLYIYPPTIDLSDTEYYDFREECIKRKN